MFFVVEKIENQLKEIRASIYRGTLEIPLFKYYECAWDDAPKGDAPQGDAMLSPAFDDSSWLDFPTGSTWGGYDRVAWFRAWLQIPPEWRQHKLALRFLVGPRDGGGSTAEALLYVDGVPLQALDAWHEEAWLPTEVVTKECVLVALKAWSGVLQVPGQRHFKQACLVWIDEAAEHFYFRATAVIKAVKALDGNDLRRVRLLKLLNEAFICIDFLKPGSQAFYASLAEAGQHLDHGLMVLQTGSEIRPRITGVGHAHIDMAWLWRLRHTREKAARTFSTALHLMRQYPGYHFMHSSPQLYKYLETDHPDIFSRVKERIQAGQWEVTGGMWVEADTNVTGGESLVRQFIYGRRYVREQFGVEMNVLWLPDVFGYSAALPQIVLKSGLKYFLTSKISWSQFNRFPYDTFRWRGLDGSELLTHFVTTPDEGSPFFTYNGRLSPGEVKGTWDQYQQKDVNEELLVLFGWGDGGGGPTREMLESALSLEDLPGMPSVSLGSAEDYFARLDERTRHQPLPVWDGELYLEYHRGTYTSQAYNKRTNRRSEILYHDAEWVSTLADLITGEDAYPADALRAGWELILLNQFHDILPGSSIHDVYEDSRKDYEGVHSIGEAARESAQARLFAHLPVQEGQVLVFNPLSWRRSGLVELPWSDALAGQVGEANIQLVECHGETRCLLAVADVPALGYAVYPPVKRIQNESVASATQVRVVAVPGNGSPTSPPPINIQSSITHTQNRVAGGEIEDVFNAPALFQGSSSQPGEHLDESLIIRPHLLENGFYRIELNARGQIERLLDKRSAREVLAPHSLANVFQVFEDKPMNFDAWDIDIYYQEKMREVADLVEAVVEEQGPLRGSLRLVWRFSDSTITQRLTLYRASPRIDFRTEVDWQEHQTLLKVAFPVNIRATRATYDIQFGSVERPTHWNTSWDWARFEVCGHKWADLSEGGYGVALLNDCKYGHDVKDNVMRLTLIKSGIEPDPQADKGRHEFTYSLLPHQGDWRDGGVVQAAYELNDPLWAQSLPQRKGLFQRAADLPRQLEFACLDVENVIVETVKQAENGDGWVVRVYEAHQRRSVRVRLQFGLPLRRAVECNLVEEDEQPVEFDQTAVYFPIQPFEIKTLKVWF